MCGIIGYAGHRPAVSVIIEGLRRLEYRGYDSAGVAFLQNNALTVIRAQGKLANLEAKLTHTNVTMATSGIGHTRWATHGAPVERNAHPHCCQDHTLAIIHNGIFENYQTLKTELAQKGYTFQSDTDTEVCANLIADCLAQTGALDTALSLALRRAQGAYAIVVCHVHNPGVLYAARQSSPLILGVGQGENFLASDVPAFLGYTRDVVFLEDGEMVRIDANSWKVMRVADLSPIQKTVHHIAWDVQVAQKGGHKHFMVKEIFEQPQVIADCLAGRLDWKQRTVTLPELQQMPLPRRLHIVSCGTSYHAGLWGKQLIEQWAKVPVSVEIASEFRYSQPLLGQDEAVLVISQSGETADTLAGLRLAKNAGLPVMGLCNVVGSSIARESDTVLYTQAGPEISVASTKAMTSQMTMLTLLALFWGTCNTMLDTKLRNTAIAGLQKLPGQLESALPGMREHAKRLARQYAAARSFFFLGRGLCYPLALEGALKLKELSYIHAEGYAAGEMKHGPIALIDPDFPTFALALNDALYPKVKSNLQEVQARSGKVIALTHPGADLVVDSPWPLPEAWGPLSSFMALAALQLFSYETADYLGKDVDQPRNLAKSVTVE